MIRIESVEESGCNTVSPSALRVYLQTSDDGRYCNRGTK